MKKLISIVVLTFGMSFSAMAQDACSDWTFNTRAWCTNYFTTVIYDFVEIGLKGLLFKGNGNDSLWAERIVPDAQMMFPIGMGKKGFEGPTDIYGPYHRAFANPFKHIGDYAVGADVSYMPKSFGLYAGAYFKSQEIVFKETDDNLRGVFYDVVTGCGGSIDDTNKDRLKGGWGLDFAISSTNKDGKSKFLIQFSMPLHNFLNDGFLGQEGMKRKVGYIALTERICL